MLVRNGVASGEAKGKGRVTAVWGTGWHRAGAPGCSADRWASDGQGGKVCVHGHDTGKCSVGPEGEMGSWSWA
jgi:hypothetical protein